MEAAITKQQNDNRLRREELKAYMLIAAGHRTKVELNKYVDEKNER